MINGRVAQKFCEAKGVTSPRSLRNAHPDEPADAQVGKDGVAERAICNRRVGGSKPPTSNPWYAGNSEAKP